MELGTKLRPPQLRTVPEGNVSPPFGYRYIPYDIPPGERCNRCAFRSSQVLAYPDAYIAVYEKSCNTDCDNKNTCYASGPYGTEPDVTHFCGCT